MSQIACNGLNDHDAYHKIVWKDNFDLGSENCYPTNFSTIGTNYWTQAITSQK